LTSNTQSFDQFHFHSQVHSLSDPTLKKILSILKGYISFNVLFFFFVSIETFLFFAFFPFFSSSSLLAFVFACIFLTLFSYCLLRLYFQTRIPDKLLDVCESYLEECRCSIGYQQNIASHHLALATAAQRLCSTLHEREYDFFAPPKRLSSLTPLFQKFSCFCFWNDFFLIKEHLLLFSVEQHLEVVKCEPTNLEVHAALANAYVMLSSLYSDPTKEEEREDQKWIHPARLQNEMKEKFKESASKAIEEFKILNHYAPNDPWVHTQLAYSYHDLQMPEEEIREYEHVLYLKPQDSETLFKLGMLYFQQGKNAQGLQIYEQLKKNNNRKAESLIKFYGDRVD
jgi:tetratricopeptide (TPR) repeat protein